MKVNIFGDIYGSLTAGTKVGTITASGDLKADASINSTAGTIDKLLISDTIYGTITANAGQGSIKQILRDKDTFMDPDVGLVDVPADHITADLTKTKWTIV